MNIDIKRLTEHQLNMLLVCCYRYQIVFKTEER